MAFTGASWFHSDELEIDRTATMVPRRDPIKVTKVFQVIETDLIFHLGKLFAVGTRFRWVSFRFYFECGFAFRLIKTQYLFAMVRL